MRVCISVFVQCKGLLLRAAGTAEEGVQRARSNKRARNHKGRRERMKNPAAMCCGQNTLEDRLKGSGW